MSGGLLAARLVQTWPLDVPLLLALGAFAGVYFAGVSRAWRRAGVGGGISTVRVVAASLGILTLVTALASPLESLSGGFFWAHMTQHLLLTLVAAPLLVWGVPLLSLLWLLEPRQRKWLVSAWRRATWLRSIWSALERPAVAWLVFVVLLWAWHVPALYELALANAAVHALEHVTLLLGAGLFWWAVLQPLGQRAAGSLAAALALFLATLQGGVLGALISLAPSPWYGHYEVVAKVSGHSALADQQLAGLIMWVPPGLVYLLLACFLLYRGLVHIDSRRTARKVAGLLLTLAGVAEAQVLQPVGPAARQVSQHFLLLLAAATVVCLVVYVLLLIAVSLRGSAPERRTPVGVGPFVVLGGIVIPLVILLPLLFQSVGLTASITRPSDDALTIEVEGHQWWWEVRYPESGVVIANEIRVPANRPVRLRLSAADVIHSFWAPGLQGKMDLIPGQMNTLWIEASEPGVFEAKCAEYCGLQHANMRLLVVSDPEESFDEWLAERVGPADEPTEELARHGRDIFMSSPCIGCHTIAGTPAQGEVGPDLTHLGSRLTLGAGTIPNNRGNLGGWISNSQAIKPGNKMPPMRLESEDLQALLAYLEGLE